jgi:hypothetical protein
LRRDLPARDSQAGRFFTAFQAEEQSMWQQMWQGVGHQFVRRQSVGQSCGAIRLCGAMRLCDAIRRASLAAVIIVAALAQAALAAPSVEFDIAPKAACRAVTAPESAKLHAGANVVEVTFDLSTRIVGNESDLKHITVEIWSPDRQLSIVGFSPTTTLQNESVDGVIEVEEHRALGQLSLEYALPTAKIQASAKNAGDSKIVEKKLAPKSLLVASGTFDRSHGVFFTLHPSTQESLQKSRQFVCQLEVPKGFRGDYIQMTCTAVAHNRGVVRSRDTEVTAGLARYTIGVYLDSDIEAKRAAELLADKQQALGLAMAHESELHKQGEPHHWWDSVGKTMLTVSHIKSQKPAPAPAGQSDVAKAAAEIEAAQQAMRGLNGQLVDGKN